MRYLICQCDPTYEAKWKDIEHSLIGVPPQALLDDINLQKNYLKKLNTRITVPLNIWHKVLEDKDVEKNAESILRWIMYDTEFIPIKLDKRFEQWANVGITSYCKISPDNSLITFQQLQNDFNLGKQDFFRQIDKLF